MKKTYTLVVAAFLFFNAFATNYPGNGKAGFGGPVGTGSLDVTSTVATYTFKLNKGTNDMNDALVIYIDSKGSGLSTTANFIDSRNELTKAVSGWDGATNRATFNFSATFRPDFALCFQPGVNGGKGILVRLVDGVDFPIKDQPVVTNGTVKNAASYEVTISSSDIDNPPVGIKFMATYISNTGYRSDEAIGDPMTDFVQGWNEYTATVDPLLFNSTLPVVFGDFTGTFVGKNVQLKWNTEVEINSASYDVLKSNNGTSWSVIGTLASRNSSTGAEYTFTDNSVPDAVSYYQIKQVDMDGSAAYSAVIIMRKDGISGITLLGNPARGAINLNISNAASATYRFDLYSIDGRKVASQVYNHGGGSGKVSLTVPGNTKGACMLRITSGNATQTIKVIVD